MKLISFLGEKPPKAVIALRKSLKARPKRKIKPTLVVVDKRNLHKIKGMKDVIFHAFKYTKANGRSPTYFEKYPYLTCKRGAVLVVKDACTDRYKDCAQGVNVATKPWCFDNMDPECHKLWLVEFKPEDIACVPEYSDGKFRLFRCKVIKQVRWSGGHQSEGRWTPYPYLW